MTTLEADRRDREGWLARAIDEDLEPGGAGDAAPRREAPTAHLREMTRSGR